MCAEGTPGNSLTNTWCPSGQPPVVGVCWFPGTGCLRQLVFCFFLWFLSDQRKERPIVSKIPVVFFLLIGIFGLWLALLLWSQTTNVSHADSRGYRSAIHTKIPLRKKTGIFGFFSPTEGWLGWAQGKETPSTPTDRWMCLPKETTYRFGWAGRARLMVVFPSARWGFLSLVYQRSPFPPTGKLKTKI